jgi:hypothetical protein
MDGLPHRSPMADPELLARLDRIALLLVALGKRL